MNEHDQDHDNNEQEVEDIEAVAADVEQDEGIAEEVASFEETADDLGETFGESAVETGEGLGLVEGLSLEAQVEAIVFASPAPVKAAEIVDFLEQRLSLKQAEAILESLVASYELRAGGFKLEYIKGFGYQFRTVTAAASIMERMFATRPRPITRAALETLSIIAYRQPCTRAEIEFVRGVDAGSIIKNLLERNLIACVGRKEEAGRPMIFGTTTEFLKIFRLNSIDELPPLQSFQPSRDMIAAAMDQINGPSDVNVEDYIGDGDQAEPLVSEGLVGAQAAASWDEADTHNQTEIQTQEAQTDEQPLGQEDTDSEMALDAGSGVTPPSGELDRSEEDLG